MQILQKMRVLIAVLGVTLFFVANRYLYAEKYFDAVNGVSLGVLFLGLVIAFFGWQKSKKIQHLGEQTAWGYTLVWQLLIFLSLVIYQIYARKIAAQTGEMTAGLKVLLAAWLTLFASGFFVGIGVEKARGFLSLQVIHEPKRIHRAAQTWFLISLLLVILVNINFVASKIDKVWDWTYLKATSPSSSTVSMIESSVEPFQAAVFIAKDNDVMPFVRNYFDLLGQKTSKLKIDYYDRDLNPVQAEEFKASKNGQIVFKVQDKQHRIQLGETIESARKKLAVLDAEVQTAYTKLVLERLSIYYSRGHGELQIGMSNDDPLRSLKFYEELLKSQNYKLKPFGITEGSEAGVPEDAACVMIVGPTSDFSQGEVDVLDQYIQKGGKLFVLQDKGGSLKEDPALAKLSQGETPRLNAFLQKMKIQFVPKTLGNQKNYVRATKSSIDHWVLFSNSFSTHESVSSLSRNDERLAVILMRASHYLISEEKPLAGEQVWKAATLIRSMDGTFEDLNANQKLEKNEEESTKTIFNLAVASEHKTNLKDSKGEDLVAKVVAVGDVQVISDALIAQNRGNAIFAMDTVRWLVGQSAFSGEPQSEEDVKIRHTNKENVVWFSATIIFCPLLVLGMGYVATRRKKRRSR